MKKTLPILIIICYFFSSVPGEMGQIGHSIAHLLEKGQQVLSTPIPSHRHGYAHDTPHKHHSHDSAGHKRHGHSSLLMTLLEIDPTDKNHHSPKQGSHSKKVDKHQKEAHNNLPELYLPRRLRRLTNELLRPSVCLPFPNPPPEV